MEQDCTLADPVASNGGVGGSEGARAPDYKQIKPVLVTADHVTNGGERGRESARAADSKKVKGDRLLIS